MIAVTARSLWAHRRRLIATVLAVGLGVAFLAGTLLLSDTLRANFSRLFTQADAGTNVVQRDRDHLRARRNPGRPRREPAAAGTERARRRRRPALPGGLRAAAGP
jgi:putative ABC transport system permease protein